MLGQLRVYSRSLWVGESSRLALPTLLGTLKADDYGLYQELADRLMKEGHAYPCFCTAEELDLQRQRSSKNSGKNGHVDEPSSLRQAGARPF